MLIEIGLKKSAFTKPMSSATICEAWQAAYAGEPFIQIMEANPEDCLIDRFLDPEAANGSNQVELLCFESQTDLLLSSSVGQSRKRRSRRSRSKFEHRAWAPRNNRSLDIKQPLTI